MSRPTLVETVQATRYRDMSGKDWPTHAQAHRASVHGLVASFLADEGVPTGTADGIAHALLEAFTIVPREPRP